MTRWKASGIHLTLSALIGLAAFCLLYFVYYPQPFFKAAGADQLVIILLGVDVVLGPLLTLAVFKSGKKSLKFDLSVIAALQMGALAYGLYVMWVARPVFIVAAVDRVEIVYANDLEAKDYASATLKQYKSVPSWGPIRVAVNSPSDGKEKMMLVESALAGRDIQYFPKYYVPLTQDKLDELIQNAIPLERTPEQSRPLIEKTIRNSGTPEDFAILPLKGRTGSITLLLRKQDGAYVDIVIANAW
jgi:hypothetical protein